MMLASVAALKCSSTLTLSLIASHAYMQCIHAIPALGKFDQFDQFDQFDLLSAAGMSITFMQLPQLQDITALRNIKAAGGDLQIYLVPK
jgi:hypothetical protein